MLARDGVYKLWWRLRARPWVSGAFLLSLILVLSAWLWAVLALGKINQPLIFHFSSYAGINAIGSLADFGNVAIFSLLAVTINFGLALALEERDWFWGKLLAAGTVFYALLIFIGFAAIISVN